AFGPLSAVDVAELRRVLDDAASRQQQVIVELHNFGAYYGRKLTVADGAQFADVWAKLAGALVGHPGLYGYELMNEPGDLPGGSATWKVLAQAGVEGVRRVDRQAWVLVPGYHWQKANTWREYNEELLVEDPVGKVLYAAHVYFDGEAPGFHRYGYEAGGAYPEIGVERVRPFVEWLRAHGVLGIITEYGVVDRDERWLTVLDNFLRVVDSEERVVGAVAWAAGPLWGTPRELGLDPLNGRDQPQMQVIARYAGGTVQPGVRRSAISPREEPAAATAVGRAIAAACQAIGQPHEQCLVRRVLLTGWSWLSDRVKTFSSPSRADG
ncbi:MAG: glycoside hydrolase family 5 protein, partial [Dehalococcoidia bacterium]|nr:glycoside hydrolase family 5 protein [Dehalococcoidia bacterium]